MSILCYHAVDPRWRSPLAVDPALFARHCGWLRRHRRVVPLAGALQEMDDRGRLPRGMASLTFDDGFSGLFEHALPVLRRAGFPATVFLVAGTLAPEAMPVDWIDRPPPHPIRTLTRDEVLEMQEAGVSFGSHSYGHRTLTSLGEEECRRDLAASKEVLEAVLGRRVEWLAYPRGLHDERVRRAARAAGFSHAFGTSKACGPPGPWSVPRIGVYPGNGTVMMRLKTSPRYARMRTSRTLSAARTRLKR